MKLKVVCLIMGLLLLASCSKSFKILIINNSHTDVKIDVGGKEIDCAQNHFVSFFPANNIHDISIIIDTKPLFYDLTNIPKSFLDIEKNSIQLDFSLMDDYKLYLLKPSKNLFREDIDIQPLGYPLIPKRN